MKSLRLALDFLPPSRPQRLLQRALWLAAGGVWLLWAFAWLWALAQPASQSGRVSALQQQAADPIWSELWPRLELLARPGISVEALTADGSRRQAQLNLLLQDRALLLPLLAELQRAAPGQVQLNEQGPAEPASGGGRVQVSLQW